MRPTYEEIMQAAIEDYCKQTKAYIKGENKGFNRRSGFIAGAKWTLKQVPECKNQTNYWFNMFNERHPDEVKEILNQTK